MTFTESVASSAFVETCKVLIVHLSKSSSKFKTLSSLNIDQVYLKASKVEEVKTIWQVDKNVNLNEFYYPSKILLDDKRIQIDSLSDIPSNGKVVIEGTAGQGKSIFLRYLTGKELKSGGKVPIFVELRKVSERSSLESLIINQLENLGISVDVNTIEHVFSSNKCCLLLDAFDEIPSSMVGDTLNYLEDLCSRYHDMLVMVTSRPGADIRHSTYFQIFKLAPLVPSEFSPILTKFFSGSEDEEKVDDIVKAIHSSQHNIAGLITTPLLLTLLTISYKSYHKIPEKLYEFYKNLFHLLATRHDATKPGFTREFLTKLNESELERLFTAFCFQCMKQDAESFTRSKALKMVDSAKEVTSLTDIDSSSFLEDTKKNTCLIVEEGLEYHFIHKSIREYHAASFIADSPEKLKLSFYSYAVTDHHRFYQEIQYLSEIDTYYCEKYFLIPKYERLFDMVGYKDGKINIIDEVMESTVINFEDKKLNSITFSHPVFSEDYFIDPHSIFLDIIFDASIQYSRENELTEEKFTLNSNEVVEKDFYDKLAGDLIDNINDLHTDYELLNAKIDKEDKIIDQFRF